MMHSEEMNLACMSWKYCTSYAGQHVKPCRGLLSVAENVTAVLYVNDNNEWIIM
jgi:hypothetical protein